jgi:hypothetical protein
LPDVFISYSSKDRVVADRVEKTLRESGYDVFWDQQTPPGTDWDSWIRERLHGSSCVIVLWSKASIASPNVRHEAIVAREEGKLLPVMIDQLGPADFPMGLYMVQGLVMGRSAKDFAAIRERLLGEVKDRIGARAGQAPAAAPRRKLRLGRATAAAGVAAALALLLFLAWPTLSAFLQSGAPVATAEEVAAARPTEAAARQRTAAAAETLLAADQAVMGTPWYAGQLLSAAPEEGRPLLDRYFAILPTAAEPQCGCYRVHDIAHTVGNAWVIITSAEFGRPPPPGLIEAMLTHQNREGWWSISLDGAGNPANAATHATAIATIALAEARRAGIVPPEQRGRVDDALRQAVGWLDRGPEQGELWSDYPANPARTPNIVFAAMATVATHLAGETGARGSAAAFLRSARTLPDPTSHFSSRATVILPGGATHSDNYRHPVAGWVGAAAALAYPNGSASEKAAMRRIVRDWLAVNLGDERLLRHDWMTGETLYLRRLAFRDLAASGR